MSKRLAGSRVGAGAGGRETVGTAVGSGTGFVVGSLPDEGAGTGVGTGDGGRVGAGSGRAVGVGYAMSGSAKGQLRPSFLLVGSEAARHTSWEAESSHAVWPLGFRPVIHGHEGGRTMGSRSSKTPQASFDVKKARWPKAVSWYENAAPKELLLLVEGSRVWPAQSSEFLRTTYASTSFVLLSMRATKRTCSGRPLSSRFATPTRYAPYGSPSSMISWPSSTTSARSWMFLMPLLASPMVCRMRTPTGGEKSGAAEATSLTA
mmetsp:Transcript_7904/g.23534  ORF Transcript_7904/g.23534 Transcript_7904/m.23534 type:complete len:262 (-) Transcript_7904:291-1076(-)